MTEQKYPISQLKRAVELEAQEREKTAAFNGAYNDGGAAALRNEVHWYSMGERGEYPKQWEKYNRHIDAEYSEYLRLQKKFGGG